jgi:hypothetical protein
MATRKTTTKAKTKTTKTTRTTAKAAAAKTTRSKVATTAKTKPAKAESKPAVQRVVDYIGQLRNLHLASVLAYAVFAILSWVLMTDTSSPVSIGYLAKDELASRTTTVFAPAVQNIFDIEYRWALLVILVLSIVLPLLYITRLRKRYEVAVAGRVLLWRWIDLAVTGALMVETIALLSGISDLPTLKLIAGLTAIGFLLGWLAERQNDRDGRPVWGAYALGVLAGLLPWALIATYAVATWTYGLVRYPWYTYALMGAVFAGFVLLALNQLQQHRRKGKWGNSLFVERNYVVANLLTKTAFAVILILGLQRP